MDSKRVRHSSVQSNSQKRLERRLRQRERKHYTEDCMNDEEIEGKRMFSVDEKLISDRFNADFVQEMTGDEVSISYFQEHGFHYPIVIKENSGLGMRLPSKNFSINDVRQCVGSRRVLDVMDVTTQKDIEMTMKEWVKYYENPLRDKLLNVISLEFSHTKLENYIESPKLVREIDWVDKVWPQHLKLSQTESTNIIDDMKYPKVQKYCLMSVKGCYTDFHIDFGGTSVWYHILHGRKVFWLIPPTETNVQLYEQWVLSGKQSDVFFGDTVDECGRIELEEGWTFFIPTGWIHAVYTPKDSLVFGGNFLHSFGIEKQLRIAQVEDVTHVPPKFRYPFYTEMLWYVLDRYVHCLMGQTHLSYEDDATSCVKRSTDEHEIENETGSPPDSPEPLRSPSPRVVSPCNAANSERAHVATLRITDVHGNADDVEGKENRWTPDKIVTNATESLISSNEASDEMKPVFNESELRNGHVHLTRFEISGLKAIARWLSHLSSSRRNVPDLIKDPVALLGDVKILLEKHCNDDPALAITGKPVLSWPTYPKKLFKPKPKIIASPPKSSSIKPSPKSSSSNSRRRRTRCKKCEACMRADCGDCHFCKDMKKFGGPGRMKQSCISRQCMAPVLPHTACCMVCGRDGWKKGVEPTDEEASSLMECSICWEIVHPECLGKPVVEPDDGAVSDDLPNSWECPKCCQNTKGGPAPKLRQLKLPGRFKLGESLNAVCLKQGKEGMMFGLDRATDYGRNPESPLKRRDVSDAASRPWKKICVGRSDEESVSDDGSDSDVKTLVVDMSKKVKKKKLMTNVRKPNYPAGKGSKVKRTGESHVRSCVQQQVSTCKPLSVCVTDVSAVQFANHPSVSKAESFDIMSVSNKREMVKIRNGVDVTDDLSVQKTTVFGFESDRDSESVNVNGLMDCQIKVLKCDGSAKTPMALSPSPLRTSLSSKANLPRNGHKGNSEKRGPLGKEQKSLKKPLYVVRPAPILETKSKTSYGNLAMSKEAVISVFRYLRPTDLCRCMLVCKMWNMWCLDKRLWSRIDLAQKKIATAHLAGIVRRQPTHLGLGWTNISKKLLGWLMARLPHLRHLDLSGCSWASVVGLATCNCPTLQSLDLKWVEGMNDARFRELVAPPHDSRPGLLESKSRLRNLLELKMSGCDVSDVSLRYLTQHLRLLSRLDLSNCTKVSDAGIALLTAVTSPTRDTVLHLDLSGCKRLTDTCIEHLKRCPNMVFVDLRNCPDVSITACRKFIAQSAQPLMMSEAKLIEKQVNYLQ